MIRLVAIVVALAVTATMVKADGLLDLRDGRAADRANNFIEAIRLYSSAIRSGELASDQLTIAYYRRGTMRGTIGDNAAAIADFSEAIRLSANHGSSFVLRAYLRGVEGDYESAERDYKRALELAPATNAQTYMAWALACYADLRRRQKRFDEAFDLISRSLRQQPSAYAYFVRAWVYLDTGSSSQAKASFELFEDEWRKKGSPPGELWPAELAVLPRLRALTGR